MIGLLYVWCSNLFPHNISFCALTLFKCCRQYFCLLFLKYVSVRRIKELITKCCVYPTALIRRFKLFMIRDRGTFSQQLIYTLTKGRISRQIKIKHLIIIKYISKLFLLNRICMLYIVRINILNFILIIEMPCNIFFL